MFDKERTDSAFRTAYKGYEHLRDNNISESSTSQELHKRDRNHMDLKLEEEFGELQEIANFNLDPDEKHPWPRRERIIREAHQAWYWVALECVTDRMTYEKLDPVKKIEKGYGAGTPLPPDSRIPVLHQIYPIEKADVVLSYIGNVCKREGIEPAEIGEHDVREMLSRSYLKEVIGG